jgi:pilus assembly protein CpaF
MVNLKLFKKMRDVVSVNFDDTPEMSNQEALACIEKVVFQLGKQLIAKEKREMVNYLFNSFRGLDAIQTLVDDNSISEIMINKFNEIYVERNGMIEKTSLQFENQQKLEDLIQMIVSKMNRSVNESKPIVDARWGRNVRVNVVLPPISLDGPVMTMRKFPENSIGFQLLIDTGSINKQAADLLQLLVVDKYNILIGGGTSSGKTTFLNALLDFINPQERLITIEDCAELNITSVKNVVRLETRNANIEGKGEISISDLIRTSLRMRPNRIIVGEVRGSEAFYMLQAMNTGHDGSMCTAHANSSSDMISRLETMVASGIDLPLSAIRKLICSAIDVIVHLSNIDGCRKVVEISELTGLNNGDIELNHLFQFEDNVLKETGNRMINCRKSI